MNMPTTLLLLCIVASAIACSKALNIPSTPATAAPRLSTTWRSISTSSPRRSFLSSSLVLPLSLIPTVAPAAVTEPRQQQNLQDYSDFTKTKSGWSYKDATSGKGGTQASKGDRVVFDWSGYTIGYFGRPFQAKGGPQGGAFDKDLDYERTVLGSGSKIAAIEEALIGMSAGQVRQVIVPYGDLSYPEFGDSNHEKVGPKPATFSGLRALNFVLENKAGTIDRTLLINLKCIRVDKKSGSGFTVER
ncbi:hypothetical protein TrLO_g15387 [Triparma laevis f. longispina]|uniref:peptidylprolyl isomerase n=1 Tax=Triparma laevis f. longispina TaxID=1714387 RepID=A0A9W7FA58_9STRA|nr:hypothetical protein TrLO_g15387 [Triparma laevis f. longispina]